MSNQLLQVSNSFGDMVELSFEGNVGQKVQLGFTSGELDGSSYCLHAEAESIDELRALISAAEPEGSEVRKRVEDLLARVSDLFAEWQAVTSGRRRSPRKG